MPTHMKTKQGEENMIAPCNKETRALSHVHVGLTKQTLSTLPPFSLYISIIIFKRRERFQYKMIEIKPEFIYFLFFQV